MLKGKRLRYHLQSVASAKSIDIQQNCWEHALHRIKCRRYKEKREYYTNRTMRSFSVEFEFTLQSVMWCQHCSVCACADIFDVLILLRQSHFV